MSRTRGTSPDRYAVQAEIAAGGTGVVYRALDRTTGEARALKRLLPALRGDATVVEAFEREYHVLAGITHPRIIRVFDYGRDAHGPYYTMELLAGDDLRKAAPLPFRKACLCLRDLAASLSLLHARRLIHRDLSPGNVRVTPDGHCKLIDFGALAPFGILRQLVGTPPATSREALEGSPVDQRADIYSLGALGYFMLTGRHAYPAERFEELFSAWETPPAAPSSYEAAIPPELDALVMAMLNHNPLARPASTAEVISRLGVIGQLEGDEDEPELAQSLLLSPAFIGRSAELAELGSRVEAAVAGRGSAVRVEAGSGSGRTRFLLEVAVRAQLAGAVVLSVDATTHHRPLGVARALALRAFDALPDAALEASNHHRGALRGLGHDIETRAAANATRHSSSLDEAVLAGGLEAWFCELGSARPLVIQVDDVDCADPQSVGLLVSLAKRSTSHPILLVVTERPRRDIDVVEALPTLRGACKTVTLGGLDAGETRQLVRSLFGQAPSVERYADWLHEWTDGSPLHSIEVSRQLVREGIVRYTDGVWVLPVERPNARLPAALEDALSFRLSALGARARSLAECLSLGRASPTYALCCALLAETEEREVLQLIGELEENDVLEVDREGYRWSSAALREALLAGLVDGERALAHRRLGNAFALLATPENTALGIEAGFHLIEGGDELRGAHMIATATHDSVRIRTLIANLHHVGTPIEAALLVYKRHRRSLYERMPLLSALAQAGFYETRSWGERYGDEALDALEEISGLRAARRLSGVLGRTLALTLGVFIAFVRFRLTPKAERGYSFAQVLVHLFGTVTTLAAAACQCLDAERGERVAEVLSPFSGLPERLTPVGIYQFCRALAQVGREQAERTSMAIETLLERFQNPRYYPTLPDEARPLYIAGAHFARGSLAVLRSDGRAALASADALDSTGLKLYRMIASQLRYLYYMNRGEHSLAAPHREQVELHAAQVGSAWQVEAWEAPAMIPISASIHDVVSLTQISERLDVYAKKLPSLRLHARLSKFALELTRRTPREHTILLVQEELEALPPRSFIGWAAACGFLARAFNETGRHDRAIEVCERTLERMTDGDGDFVTLFLIVELELAMGLTGLGRHDEAFARVDALVARFAGSDHPLLVGRLHEVRALVAWTAGREVEYAESQRLMAERFRPTGTPALIACCERIAGLGQSKTEPRSVLTGEQRDAGTLREALRNA
jgi:hypothetical protein